MAHTSGGRQLHPDQTTAVKGQNGKTLVTVGIIKRLVPCPVERIGKQSIFDGVKKNITKTKEKNIRKNADK